MSEYVTLKQLSDEFGLDKSNLRKYILKAGFSFIRMRTPESRAQLTLALTAEDAEAVRELRQEQGFLGQSRPIENGEGWFYVVQVIPEFDPNRVKLGFATDANSRLMTHRTSAPTAQLIKAWPCQKSWETAAIASVTRTDCTLVANEVFTCKDLTDLVNRCDAFFNLMPSI